MITTRKTNNEFLVLKTNIRYKKDLKLIESILNKQSSVICWNVDIEDVDKVLRVQSTTENTQETIDLIKNAGYDCEELKD